MNRFYVSFENSESKETESGISIPRDYSFWNKLMDYFINRSTCFRMECFKDEEEAIRSASKHGSSVESVASKMLAFEGRITEDFITEVLESPYDNEGKIKWFNLNLKLDEEYIICSSHYGSEFVTGWLREEDKEFIREILPKDFLLNVVYED